MTGGKAAGLDAHRAANPIAVAPFLIELAAERLARRMPGENIGGRVEAVSSLAHAVVHVVVLRAAQAFVIQPDPIMDLTAVERIGKRIHIARLAAVAERRCSAAETGGIQRASHGFPVAFRFCAAYAAADDILAVFQRTDIFFEEILRDACVRIQTDYGVACGCLQGDVDAAGEPTLRVVQHLDGKRRTLGKIAHHLPCSVRGCAVYEQHLKLARRKCLREKIVQQRTQTLFCVVCDDNKARLWSS